MIRVLLVDDHPALRAGLYAVLRAEPGIVPQAAASSPTEALAQIERDRPDIVLADYHLQEGDGLTLCHRLKSRPDPPRVLIYSAYADTQLTIPAIVAGADGVANKAAPAEELFDAIRVISKGGTLLPPVPRELLEEASGRLDPDDLPILGMIMDRTSHAEMADVLQLRPGQLEERVARMLRALRVETPGVAA
ncbi:MAG TPA: response regulator transcription factor [Thermoleophilaceae bacterium]|nr:response regulator transcription factor [Thermoleophilaceae bacterium]